MFFLFFKSAEGLIKSKITVLPSDNKGKHGALLVVVWPVNRPDHDQQRCYHYAPTVKP
jgi:hypothetical protein